MLRGVEGERIRTELVHGVEWEERFGLGARQLAASPLASIFVPQELRRRVPSILYN